MHFLSKEQLGILYATLSGISYGLLGYFGVSIMNVDLTVPNMLFWRFFVSSLLTGIIVFLKYIDLLTNTKANLKILFYGAIFYSGSSILYFIACKYLGTGLTMVIFFIYPAIVILLNWLFHKMVVNKIYYLTIFLFIIGMMFFVDVNEFRFDLIGIGLSLLSAVFYAGYIVSNKENNVTPIASTFMVSLGCMLTSLVFSCIQQKLPVPNTFNLWINIISMSIICTILPIFLFLQAIKYISAEKASILSVLEPVFVVIFGILLLNETINITKILGIIIVLSGTLIVLINKQEKENIETNSSATDSSTLFILSKSD